MNSNHNLKLFAMAFGIIAFTAAHADVSLSTTEVISESNGNNYVQQVNSSTGASTTETYGTSFTGLDSSGDTQTMSFSGTSTGSAEYGNLHCYSTLSATNTYYNAANNPYATASGADTTGSPQNLFSLTFASFNDTLQYGGALQAGYKASYVFAVDGTNSGTGALADLGVTIDGNPTESFFEGNLGPNTDIWATQQYAINGITPQQINVEFSNQVTFNLDQMTDGSNPVGTSDYSETATLQQINIYDANGNLVGGVTVQSGSGTHYQVAPEPPVFILLGGALGLAVYLRKRA